MRLPLIAARGFESHPLRHMKYEVLYEVQDFFFLSDEERGLRVWCESFFVLREGVWSFACGADFFA